MLGADANKEAQVWPEKRPKERSIKEVIDALYLWKLLQEGFNTTDAASKNNIFVRYDAWQAAEHTKISKRTLDDYLMQIRAAFREGFDFGKNANELMGTLRKFNLSKKSADMGDYIQGSAPHKTL